jgi:hypothetical protein
MFRGGTANVHLKLFNKLLNFKWFKIPGVYRKESSYLKINVHVIK